jgi:hypothetical protein
MLFSDIWDPDRVQCNIEQRHLRGHLLRYGNASIDF